MGNDTNPDQIIACILRLTVLQIMAEDPFMSFAKGRDFKPTRRTMKIAAKGSWKMKQLQDSRHDV